MVPFYCYFLTPFQVDISFVWIKSFSLTISSRVNLKKGSYERWSRFLTFKCSTVIYAIKEAHPSIHEAIAWLHCTNNSLVRQVYLINPIGPYFLCVCSRQVERFSFGKGQSRRGPTVATPHLYDY